MPVRTVSTGPRSVPGGEMRVTLGLSGNISVQDGFAMIPLELGTTQHFRCRSVHAWLDTAPTGSDAHFSLDYSTDNGDTWNPLLSLESSGGGEVVITAGNRRSAKYTFFFNHPLASDLDYDAVVRGNITQIGSGTAGAGLKLQLKGDVWSD